MAWMLLFLVPAAFFVALDALLFGRRPAWWHVPGWARSLGHRLRPPAPVWYDPFFALQVQHRLGVLAAEIQRLEGDRFVFAKAHRIHVAQAAYDAVLAEACQLAGVDRVWAEADLDSGAGPPRPPHLDNPRRVREELELASRGWFW